MAMAKRNSAKKSDHDESEEPKAAAPQMTEEKPRMRPMEEQGQRAPPNHIFVGKKPVMSYAMSALIQLTQSGEITVKARGLAISRAVDVAEIVTKRLGGGSFVVKNISIETEQLGLGEEMRNVSSIEIVVGKK
jgi:DNA-binding protein